MFSAPLPRPINWKTYVMLTLLAFFLMAPFFSFRFDADIRSVAEAGRWYSIVIPNILFILSDVMMSYVYHHKPVWLKYYNYNLQFGVIFTVFPLVLFVLFNWALRNFGQSSTVFLAYLVCIVLFSFGLVPLIRYIRSLLLMRLKKTGNKKVAIVDAVKVGGLSFKRRISALNLVVKYEDKIFESTDIWLPKLYEYGPNGLNGKKVDIYFDQNSSKRYYIDFECLSLD